MFEDKEDADCAVWKDVELDLEAIDMWKEEVGVEDSARDML